MITKKVMQNSHDNKESLHLISDKRTKSGEEVCVCTDLIKHFEISRDIVNLIDIQERSIASADIVIETDYIDDKIYMVLKTSMASVPEITVELDTEKYVDSLVESVDFQKVLGKTYYIRKIKDDLMKELETNLLEEHGRILNSTEPVTAYIKVFDSRDNLITKANRFKFNANVSSLDIMLCECLGSDCKEYKVDASFRVEFYVGSKKIVAEDVEIDESYTKHRISYIKASCYRSNLSIEDGDIELYNTAIDAIKNLELGCAEDAEILLDFLIENNIPQRLLSYVRKNKIKSVVEGIDINKYLLEDLL